jgi:hypothetical protein
VTLEPAHQGAPNGIRGFPEADEFVAQEERAIVRVPRFNGR